MFRTASENWKSSGRPSKDKGSARFHALAASMPKVSADKQQLGSGVACDGERRTKPDIDSHALALASAAYAAAGIMDASVLAADNSAALGSIHR